MADKTPIFDGQTDFSGGMDASRSPELINPNQIALGVNVTVRGAYPATRPAFNKLRLDFAGDTEAESYWNENFYQGTGYFNPSGNTPGFTTSVGGRIFNLQPQGIRTFQVTDITPKLSTGSLDVNSARLTKAYFTQASVYQVIQDGQSLPFIFDGSTVRRSNPEVPEVPTGAVMAYGQSRLAVALGNQFLIGDINGGATNVLSFTETTYLNGGGSFLLPMNMGNVTGMIFTAKQDTNTGQGTLLVFGESGVISVDLSIPREQWQTSQIVTVTLTDIGTLADRALQTVNADILFRGKDGIRSYRDARAEFGPYSVGNFGRTAMSYEIGPYLDVDTLAWQPYVSAVNFDNRYLMTTQPTRLGGSGPPVFRAIAAMDFIAVTALRYNQPPVFDGLWTGLNVYQLTQGQFASGLRCFAFVRGTDNLGNQQLQIWEITKNAGLDNGICPIQCAIESRSFLFNSALGYKRLNYLRHWSDQIQGRVDWTLRLKPDQYPGWALWQKWTDQAPTQTCNNTGCSIPNYQPQYRSGRNATLAPEGCLSDGSMAWRYRTGFSYQVRLEWSGVARLNKLLFQAQPQDIPKLDCLTESPPDDPIGAIVANIPPANQYFNEEVSYQCPVGYVGTPITVPAGTFSSTVSVEDANSQALVYAQSQSNCQQIVSYITLEMQGPVDDDVILKINGNIPIQSGSTIQYWDYNTNAWSNNWVSTQLPSPVPGGQTIYPITSTNRNWNVLWYAGSNYLTQNFVKIKYSGILSIGDVVQILAFDGWQTEYRLAPWKVTVYYYNGSNQVFTGGSTVIGVSPNTPSPPRVNPVSAPPYDTIADLTAFLGLPDYRSQGYPNSGPFFQDTYADGTFTIPSP